MGDRKKDTSVSGDNLPQFLFGQGHIFRHDVGDVHEVVIHLTNLRIFAEQVHQLFDPDDAPVIKRLFG